MAKPNETVHKNSKMPDFIKCGRCSREYNRFIHLYCPNCGKPNPTDVNAVDSGETCSMAKTKCTVQWQDCDVWREEKVSLSYTRNDNFSFRHAGKTYVFKDLKDGTPIMQVQERKWVKVGRVAHGILFLGEGQTYQEYRRQQVKEKLEKPVPT